MSTERHRTAMNGTDGRRNSLTHSPREYRHPIHNRRLMKVLEMARLGGGELFEPFIMVYHGAFVGADRMHAVPQRRAEDRGGGLSV